MFLRSLFGPSSDESADGALTAFAERQWADFLESVPSVQLLGEVRSALSTALSVDDYIALDGVDVEQLVCADTAHDETIARMKTAHHDKLSTAPRSTAGPEAFGVAWRGRPDISHSASASLAAMQLLWLHMTQNELSHMPTSTSPDDSDKIVPFSRNAAIEATDILAAVFGEQINAGANVTRGLEGIWADDAKLESMTARAKEIQRQGTETRRSKDTVLALEAEAIFIRGSAVGAADGDRSDSTPDAVEMAILLVHNQALS